MGAINRIPAEGHTRSNLRVGGAAAPVDLTARDREICAIIGPELKKRGLVFVGIDVIGDYLTEINVTSPTGAQQLKRFTGIDATAIMWDAVEARATKSATLTSRWRRRLGDISSRRLRRRLTLAVPRRSRVPPDVDRGRPNAHLLLYGSLRRGERQFDTHWTSARRCVAEYRTAQVSAGQDCTHLGDSSGRGASTPGPARPDRRASCSAVASTLRADRHGLDAFERLSRQGPAGPYQPGHPAARGSLYLPAPRRSRSTQIRPAPALGMSSGRPAGPAEVRAARCPTRRVARTQRAEATRVGRP